MKRFLLGTLLFGSLSFAPVMLAQDHDGDHARDDHHDQPKVYYDRVHKDKHEWNDSESSNWDRYRNEHHVNQTEFAKASHRQQQNYWNWRHDHPDTH